MPAPGIGDFLQVGEQYNQQGAREFQNAGMAAKLQDHFRGVAREQKLREALNALPPDASMEDRIKAVTPFASSKEILDFGARHQDRQDAMAEKKRAMLQQVIDEKNQLDSMKGQQVPVNRQFGSVAPGVPQGTVDDQALQQFQAMPPGPKSLTISPQGTPDPVQVPATFEGGDFAPLMGSTNPAIAARAKQLQDAVNSGTIKAKEARLALDGLIKQEAAFTQQDKRDQFRVDNKSVAPTAVDAVPEEHANLHGEEYLATLPQGMRNKLKGVAEGKVPLTSFSVRNNERDKIIQMVSQYDPTFEAGKAPARMAVQRDFTSGVASRNVTALNTAIAHMGTMSRLGDALGNHDLKAINAMANAVGIQLGKQEANNFDLARVAVGDELMRVFRQVGASDSEANQWKERFTNANSPEQIKGSLRTAAELLKGRIDALNDTWDRGMDTTGGYPKLLSDRSKAVMDSFSAAGKSVKAEPYSDAEKERRYQEWKAKQK